MKKLLFAGLALLVSTFVFSQHIKGKVTDEQGTPLPGASVQLLETRQGTVTDGLGSFSFQLTARGNYTLRTSFVGYETDERPVSLPAEGDAVVTVALRETTTLLQALTVTAVRAGERSPFTYTNVEDKELATRNLGQDVPYLLDAMPSVVTTSDAGAGVGYTGIRIRGTDASRINVTINGVPLNDAESQGVYWVNLPDLASSTESIQVQRGVGTSTNGGGAFGASINLNTSDLRSKPYAEVSQSIGSFYTFKSSLKAGTGLFGKNAKTDGTGFSIDGRASRIRSEGYIDRASSELMSAYLSPAYTGKHFSLRGILLHGDEVTYQAWYGVPAQYVNDPTLRTYNPAGTERPEKPYPNEVDDYRQTHAQIIYNQELSRNWHLNLTGHYTRGLGFYEQYKANQTLTDYGLEYTQTGWFYTNLVRRRWLDNHFFGGVGSANFVSNDKRLEATIGGALSRYLGDHYGTVKNLVEPIEPIEVVPGHRYYEGLGDKTDANAFAKLQYALSHRLHGFIDLQARKVDYRAEFDDLYAQGGAVYYAAEGDYLFFNPKAGLFYEANRHVSVYASHAVGQKEPNRDDFLDAPNGQTPKPERLYNTELGFRYRAERTAFSANLYHMLYRDQLVLTGRINDTGAPIRINVPKSYRFGLELTGRALLGQHWLLEGNATLSSNKIKEFTEYVDNWNTGMQAARPKRNTDIAFSPGLVAFGKIGWNSSASFATDGLGFSAFLATKHVGAQYIDNSSNNFTKLPAYTTLEAQLGYTTKPKFVKSLSVNLLVQNLLGAKYSSNAWTYRFIASGDLGQLNDPYVRRELGDFYNMTGFFPQAGRTFLLGVTVGF